MRDAMPAQAIDLIQTVLQWVTAPIIAFVVWLHNRVQNHETDIKVLKAQADLLHASHREEMAQIRETTRAIMAKLDSIEQALRK
jgi:F0F1-type ATP synthase membrane subunit b/b'